MNSRLLQVLAAVLVIAALVAGYMGYQTTSAAQQALEEAKRAAAGAGNAEGQAAVIVLSRPVTKFTTLTAADLAVDYLKVSPPGTFQKIEQVVGSTTQIALPSGTIVLPEHFSPGGKVARLLRPGERAVAIAVNDVVGGGGFVQPGDMVDILLFLEKQDSRRDSAQIILKSVRVLSFGENLIDVSASEKTDKDDKDKKQERERSAKTAVLAIAETDVTRLMLASTLGELRLAIVPTEEMHLAINPQPAEAGADGMKLNAMLPKVELISSVAKPASAVPSQRFFLTDSALQTASMSSPVKSAHRSSRPASSTTVVAQQVIIIRGLSTEATKK